MSLRSIGENEAKGNAEVRSRRNIRMKKRLLPGSGSGQNWAKSILPEAKHEVGRWHPATARNLIEIQDAATHLPSNEKKTLQLWLNSQGEPELTAHAEQHLFHSLAPMLRKNEADKGVSNGAARERVGSWAAKNLLGARHRGFGIRRSFHCQREPSVALRVAEALIDRNASSKNFPTLDSASSAPPGCAHWCHTLTTAITGPGWESIGCRICATAMARAGEPES